MPPLSFPQVLEKALIAYRIRQTQNRGSVSINSFALFLGYSRPMVTLWMNGQRSIPYDTLEKILPKLEDLIGAEVYNMVEHPIPDIILVHIIDSWDDLTEDQRMELSGMMDEFERENETDKSGNQNLSKSIA